jgi:hypothetical protein
VSFSCVILISKSLISVTLEWKLNYLSSKKVILFNFCYANTFSCLIRRGADKSLAGPTSRCRRTESIMSLERGVCSSAELQVFSCYRDWKEVCQATCAILTTSRRELSSSFFPLQGKGIHTLLTRALGENAPCMVPSKTGWSSLNVVYFPPVIRKVLDNTNQWPPRRLLNKFTS